MFTFGDRSGTVSASNLDDNFSFLATTKADKTTLIQGAGLAIGSVTGAGAFITVPGASNDDIDAGTSTTVAVTPAGLKRRTDAVSLTAAQRAANLSDLASTSAARANLGLGSMAQLSGTPLLIGARGTADGVAPLGPDGKVPAANVPVASVAGLTGAITATDLFNAMRAAGLFDAFVGV